MLKEMNASDRMQCPECGHRMEGIAGDYVVWKDNHIEDHECEGCEITFSVQMKTLDKVLVFTEYESEAT